MNIIYGFAPVLEAVRAGRRPIQKLLITSSGSPERLRPLLEAAQSARIPCERRERRELDTLTRGANHQGVIAMLGAGGRRGNYVEPAEILDAAATGSRPPLVVLLDGVEDPHNLGAILRTCECAGVDGVFLPEHRAAGITETVAKTSAGAVEYLRIAQVTNLVPLINELKERGYWVAAIEGGMGTVYSEFDLSVPLAVVMGSEGKGVRRLVREKCDVTLSIPMHGQVNSLNVSVATGILLFEILRQRRASGDRQTVSADAK